MDELAETKDNIFNRISEGRFTKKTLKSNIDLVDEAGNTLFRLAKEDYEKFISFPKKTSKERKNIIEEVNLQLKSSSKKYNSENAKLKGYDVPKSKVGTSPDFSTTPQHLYNNKSIVKIKIKGERNLDFIESFKAMDITDKKAMKAILKDYTWHHLDDLTAELECTMQLVTQEAHRATYTHFGSAGQAQKSIPLKKYLTL
ncbi:HNH endonuclease [uncultured Chryseobacterium sp.]|uniref:HNH endonuclease signature motif containing protein n=2 Tax=Chryseobacterium TaxID=59732 RepID=UPI0037478637